MKTNKLIAGIAAFALAAPMFTSSVFAAWDGAAVSAGGATVSYDNSSSIPDPDNPSNPKWAVKVPSSVKFTDANKKVDATVSIETINGGAMPGYELFVSVKSLNGYKLKLAGAVEDPLDYDLQYGGKSVKAAADKPVDLGSFGTSAASGDKITGTATLSSTQSATETGSHTDTLTYMISKTATPAKP